MLGAAGAADPVHVVLADLDPNLGQIVHLVGARDAHIVRVSQIRPAPAPTSRTVRHPLIRDAYPRHRVAFGALLLSRLAPRVLHPLRCRLSPSRKIITGRSMEELPLFREACRSAGAPAPPAPRWTHATAAPQRSAPRATARPIQTQRKIITSHSQLITPDTPKIKLPT
jgi:hypothetical protein